MDQHVKTYQNRIQWLALAAEIALLPVPTVRAQAERAARAEAGSFSVFMETLILSIVAPKGVTA